MAIEFVKYFKFGLVLIVFSTLVTGIVSGVITGIKEGDWKPLAHSTIGETLSADDFVYRGVGILKNQELINQKQYPNEFIDSIREQILISLFIILSVIWFIIYVTGKFFGTAQLEPHIKVLKVVVAILVYIALSMGYLLWFKLSTHESIKVIEMIPIKGIVSYFFNINKVYSATGVGSLSNGWRENPISLEVG